MAVFESEYENTVKIFLMPTSLGHAGVVADFLMINPLSTARSVGERVRVRGVKTPYTLNWGYEHE